MSRPKSENKKSHTVKVRMTDREFQELTKYTEKHDMTMSEAIRKGLATIEWYDELDARIKRTNIML